MVQTSADMANRTYTVYNNSLDQEIQVNSTGAKILRNINNNNYVDNTDETEFIKQLIETGIVIDDEEWTGNDKAFLGTRCLFKYPLTALSIELVDYCNLSCKHCYGKFSTNNKVKNAISLDRIKKLYEELGYLHTKKIALTGGEVTLHPHFVEIAIFFLEKGFDLTIFTNGYNYLVIEKLLEASSDYHYTIKVSLDGIGSTHDLIRGKEGTFSRVEKTIARILKYSNVTLYISTVIMRQNIESIEKMQQYVEEKYPSAFHTFDFIFPEGNATIENTFTVAEMKKIMETYPRLFVTELSVGSKKDKFRCTGGITQCTLSYDGTLKICNSACNDMFRFRNNAFQKGLAYSWKHCGANIKKFRNEKNHKTKDCNRCKNVKFCNVRDCRIMALAYSKDVNRSNPITCCTTELLQERSRI